MDLQKSARAQKKLKRTEEPVLAVSSTSYVPHKKNEIKKYLYNPDIGVVLKESPRIVEIMGPPQTDRQRDGSKIRLTHLKIEAEMYGELPSNRIVSGRFVVFWWKDNKTMPAPGAIFQFLDVEETSSLVPYNHQSHESYTIIYDKATVVNFTGASNSYCFNWSIDRKVSQLQGYPDQAPGSPSAQPLDTGLYVMFLVDSVLDANVGMTSRFWCDLTYVDV